MLIGAPGHPAYRLRVLQGALQGAAYLLRDSFVIGRSAACDLVLPDRLVSRLHARVGRDGTGEHVVHDLDSSHGTRVNGGSIHAHTLSQRDEIAIGDHVFRYERIPVLEPEEHAPSSVPLPRPGFGARTRPDPRPIAPPCAAAYDGDLVGDVIQYRSLANRSARGEAFDLRTRERLHALAGRLRDTAGDGFRQFPYPVIARVRGGTTDGGQEVDVVTLGVGGATIRTAQPILVPDEVVHLVFDRPKERGRGRIALVGVAAVVDAAACRIAFSFGVGATPRGASCVDPSPPRLHGPRTRSMACTEE